MLEPVVLAALVVLVLNDQVLKERWPGLVTGKLSDIAGLIVAPLALQAAWELVAWARARERWAGPSQRALIVAIVVVGVGFTAIQLWSPAVELYRWALGAAQWPFGALAAVLAGHRLPSIAPVVATPDVADLLTLPALAVAWWVGLRRTARWRERDGRAQA